MEYKEEDYLLLSGIQHFVFCRRQWALIHIEKQWAENVRTISGQIIHEVAHDSTRREKRNDTIIIRGMTVHSASLGVVGNCDVVEFVKDSISGISLQGEKDKYIPFPIEYKNGSKRNDLANELQLCCQAMCLEEMFACDIPQGALYFNQTKHRLLVEFTPELRQMVKDTLLEMHSLFLRGYTPKVKPSNSCRLCSLSELCLPVVMKRWDVREYIQKSMVDDI